MLTGRVGGKPQNNPSIDEVSVKGLAYVLENKCNDVKFQISKKHRNKQNEQEINRNRNNGVSSRFHTPRMTIVND